MCKFTVIDGTAVIAWLQEVWLYVTNKILEPRPRHQLRHINNRNPSCEVAFQRHLEDGTFTSTAQAAVLSYHRTITRSPLQRIVTVQTPDLDTTVATRKATMISISDKTWHIESKL